MIANHILSIAIWSPIFFGILLLLLNKKLSTRKINYLALFGALVSFIVTIPIYKNFNTTLSTFQFQEFHHWITPFNINYHLGVDGFSVPLILLTSFMTIMVILISYQSQRFKSASYYSAFLIMSGLMIGVFCALDSILYYIFWEAMLIPMFLIIGIWGGPNRIYATIKFFLYTVLGSLLMLLAFLYLYFKSGTFSIIDYYYLPISLEAQILIFLAFFMAFAVKIPMWPLHTWLPDAHVQAPTGGSVILAAIMLKLGGYSFIRFAMPIAPDATLLLKPLMISLSLVAIVYIALVALIQKDMKKLIAYSSISHMGFVTLGLFLVSPLAVEGAYIQMISHGFISAAMFLCVGVLYDRMHTREISAYGGVINTMPVFAGFSVFFAMANAGLPGTSGFVGEFMVILAAFQANFWYAFLAATTLILGAGYSLWMVKRVIFGEVSNDNVAELQDLNQREFMMLGVLAIIVLGIGLWPGPLIDVMHASVEHLLTQVLQSKL